MKKIVRKILLFVVVGSLFVSCEETTIDQDNNNVVVTEEIKQTPSNDEEASEEIPEKTDAEMIAEAIPVAIDLTKTVIKNIKINDSIKMANREQMFAYQIGLPIRHIDEVFEAYKKLDNTESVYVMEKSRKEYYLIKYEGKSENELDNGLGTFNSELPIEIAGKAKVINLMNLCSRREKLTVGENIEKRKEDVELPCLICK